MKTPGKSKRLRQTSAISGIGAEQYAQLRFFLLS